MRLEEAGEAMAYTYLCVYIQRLYLGSLVGPYDVESYLGHTMEGEVGGVSLSLSRRRRLGPMSGSQDGGEFLSRVLRRTRS